MEETLRRALIVLGIAACATATQMGTPLRSGAAGLPVAPLPPQPGLASPSCAAPHGTPGRWTNVVTAPSGAAPAPFTFDPSMPCRAYAISDSTTLQRSVDSGRTWQTVLYDDATGVAAGLPSSRRFELVQAYAPSPGRVMLAEDGNGDGVVGSDDSGRTWSLRDAGLQQEQVVHLVFSTADPATGYAEVVDSAALVTSPGQPPLVVGLYLTRDGGATWSPSSPGTNAALPLAAVDTGSAGTVAAPPILTMDPGVPGHLWAVAGNHADVTNGTFTPQGSSRAGSTDLVESSDFGATWRDDGPLPEVTADTATQGGNPGAVTPEQVLAGRTPDGRTRLFASYAPGTYSDLATRYFSDTLYVSDDDGTTWRLLHLPSGPLSESILAVDPWHPSTVVYAGFTSSQLVSFASTDGFVTAGRIPGIGNLDHPHLVLCNDPFYDGAPPPGGYCSARTGRQSSGSSSMVTTDVSPALQVDRAGEFLLGVATSDGPQAGQRVAYWRFTPVAAARGAGLPGAGCGTTGGCVPTPAESVPPLPTASVMPTVWSCQLGPQTAYSSGATLAFDGRDLLYVSRTPPVTATPDVAQIHVLAPFPACLDLGVINVSFDPRRYPYLHGGQGIPAAGLAYDPTRNVIWLQVMDAKNTSLGWLAEVRVTEPARGPLAPGTAIGAVQYSMAVAPDCGFTYDWTTDTLLSCAIPGEPVTAPGGRFRPLDGRRVPSCLDAVSWGGGGGVSANGAAFADHGRVLYYESEEGGVPSENNEMFALHTDGCQTFETYVHRVMGETFAEDDQLACDGITFGPHSGFAAPVSVVWERDEEANNVSAFAILDGGCPWPTTTRYLGPLSAETGSSIDMCATLHSGGLDLPLDGLPLEFRLGSGRLGQPLTGGAVSGRACVTTAVTLPPGRYPVHVSFAGDSEYDGSADDQTLTVWAPPASTSWPPRGAGLSPVAPLPGQSLLQPGPNPQPQASTGPQLQAQVQSQVQSQSQSQAQVQASTQVQPGAMLQRREQRQVATQASRPALPTLQANLAVRRRQALPVVPLVAGVMASALAVIARRPALRVARGGRARPPNHHRRR